MTDLANRHVADLAELSPAEMEQVQGGTNVEATVKVLNASSTTFVGGWGSSMYQYSFEGTSSY